MPKITEQLTRPAFNLAESQMMLRVIREYQWPENEMLEGAILWERLQKAFSTFLLMNGMLNVRSPEPSKEDFDALDAQLAALDAQLKLNSLP